MPIRKTPRAQTSEPKAFQDEMASSFGIGLSVAPVGDPDFLAEVEGYAGKRLRFASLHFSAHKTSATRYRPDAKRMLVSLNQEGTVIVQQDGRSAVVGPDHMYMIDPSRPFHIETGSIWTNSLYVDLALLRNVLPGVGHMTARAVSTRTGVGAILKSFVRDMLHERESLNDRQADALAAAIPYLIAAVFGEFVQDDALGSAHRQQHRNRVIEHIEANLGDPGLSPAKVAASVGISVRYLHDLFSDIDTSLMQLVWRKRLECAYAELTSPLMRRQTIGEIAFAWGFKHLAHFSRLFRAEYGTAPSKLRSNLA